MRKTITTLALATAAAAAIAAPATMASATTPAATTGALGAYAGTQVDGNQLAIDVYRQTAKAGTPVIAWPNSTSDPATDFAWLVPAGSYPSGSKEAIYDPSGKDTGLCLTEQGSGHWLVLAACAGKATQVWAYNGTGWTNAADGLVLTEHGHGKQLTDAATVPSSATQTWTFDS